MLAQLPHPWDSSIFSLTPDLPCTCRTDSMRQPPRGLAAPVKMHVTATFLLQARRIPTYPGLFSRQRNSVMARLLRHALKLKHLYLHRKHQAEPYHIKSIRRTRKPCLRLLNLEQPMHTASCWRVKTIVRTCSRQCWAQSHVNGGPVPRLVCSTYEASRKLTSHCGPRREDSPLSPAES